MHPNDFSRFIKGREKADSTSDVGREASNVKGRALLKHRTVQHVKQQSSFGERKHWGDEEADDEGDDETPPLTESNIAITDSHPPTNRPENSPLRGGEDLQVSPDKEQE